MKILLTLLVAVSLAVSLIACTSTSTQSTASTSPMTTLSATTSPTSLATTKSTSAAIGTFGSLSQAGETVFLAGCASCHGANRPLWGTSAQLSKYNSAQDLLSFISTAMPANAPGSLSNQDYLNVLSYLLIQNDDISPGTAFSESQSSSIALK